MDYDALDFLIEAEERGLLRDPPPHDLPKVKGHCRYCGKSVARGIWAHEKSCKAKPN